MGLLPDWAETSPFRSSVSWTMLCMWDMPANKARPAILSGFAIRLYVVRNLNGHWGTTVLHTKSKILQRLTGKLLS